MRPAAPPGDRPAKGLQIREIAAVLGFSAALVVVGAGGAGAAPYAAAGSIAKPLVEVAPQGSPQGVPTSQLDPNVGALRITNEFYGWLQAQILQILTESAPNGQPYLLNWINLLLRQASTAGDPNAILTDGPTDYAYLSGYIPKVNRLDLPSGTGILLGGLYNPNARLAYAFDNPPVAPFPNDGLLFRYVTNGLTINFTPELTVNGPSAEVPPLCHTTDDFLQFDVDLAGGASLDMVFRTPTGYIDTCGDGPSAASCLHTCPGNLSQMDCTRPGEVVYSPYDPATDASNYVNGTALAWIPQVRLSMGVRILAENHDNTIPNSVILGIDLQEVSLSAMADFVVNPVTDTSIYQLGEFPPCGGAAQPLCPWWDVSTDFPQILPFFDAELTLSAVNNLKNTICRPDGTTCDFYFGPTPLVDLKGLGTFAHPLTPVPQNLIALDFGAQSRFWSDSVGTYIPADLGLAISYFLADGVTPVPSCVVEPQPSPLPGVLAPIYSTLSSPWFPTCATDPTEASFRNLYPVGTTFSPPGSVFPPGPTTYFLGATIHENALTKMLYKAIVSGVTCLWIDGSLSLLGTNLGGILNADVFKIFVSGIFESFPGAPVAIQIQSLLADPRDGSTGPQDEPRVIAGCTYDPILEPNCPSYPGGNPFPGQPTLANPTSEVTVVLPHNAVNFFVQDNRVNPPQWLRVFGLDLGVGASFALNILSPQPGDPCFTYSDWACDNAQGKCKCYCAPCPGQQNQKDPPPASCFAGGCPSDCGDGSAGHVPQARRIVLTFATAPTIQEFLEFFEAFPNKTHWDLQNLFGNLIGIVLGGLQTQIQLPFCIDLSAIVRANVGFDVPYIGPDGPDWDLNGFGDYLSLYFKLNGSFTARNVVDLVTSGALTSLTSLTGGGGGGSSGGLGSLGSFLGTGAPPESNPPGPQSGVPRTFVTGLSRTGDREWTAEFQAVEPGRPQAHFEYAWSLDGSLWHHFQASPRVPIGGLWEGNHTFSVMAIDERRHLEPVPVRFPFRVDTLPPTIVVRSLDEAPPGGGTLQGPTVRVSILARDDQAPPESLEVSWRVDDASWSPWIPYLSSRTFETKVAAGPHTLDVRARDDLGNVGDATASFASAAGGRAWGCSSTPAEGDGGCASVFLVLLFGALRRRFRIA